MRSDPLAVQLDNSPVSSSLMYQIEQQFSEYYYYQHTCIITYIYNPTIYGYSL